MPNPYSALGVRNAINSAAKCSLTGEPGGVIMWAVGPPVKLHFAAELMVFLTPKAEFNRIC